MTKKTKGVPLEIGGKSYTLCMNLGAMAEMEEGLELDSITELTKRFSSGKVKIRDLIIILAALIRGGGYDIPDSEVNSFELDSVDAFGKAMEAISIQGGSKDTSGKKEESKTRAKTKTKAKARAKRKNSRGKK